MVYRDVGTIFTMVGERPAFAYEQDGKLTYWGSMLSLGLRSASS
jgi:hypothetical protein